MTPSTNQDSNVSMQVLQYSKMSQNSDLKGYCKNQTQAIMSCVTKSCHFPSNVCFVQGCNCLADHQDCVFTQIKTLIEKIVQKTDAIKRPLRKLESWYDQIISLFIQERNNLRMHIDKAGTSGLNSWQLKFLGSLGKKSVLTGSQMQKVVVESRTNPTSRTGQLSQTISLLVQQQEKEINGILKYIRESVQLHNLVYPHETTQVDSDTICKVEDRNIFQGVYIQTPYEPKELTMTQDETEIKNTESPLLLKSEIRNMKSEELSYAFQASEVRSATLSSNQDQSDKLTFVERGRHISHASHADQKAQSEARVEIENCNIHAINCGRKTYQSPNISSHFSLKQLTQLCIYNLNPVAVVSIGDFCPNLTQLVIGPRATDLNDKCCNTIAKHLTQLQGLRIVDSAITDNGCLTIVRSLKFLTKIALTHNSKVTRSVKPNILKILPKCSVSILFRKSVTDKPQN